MQLAFFNMKQHGDGNTVDICTCSFRRRCALYLRALVFSRFKLDAAILSICLPVTEDSCVSRRPCPENRGREVFSTTLSGRKPVSMQSHFENGGKNVLTLMHPVPALGTYCKVFPTIFR
jgi:hypothetical protein